MLDQKDLKQIGGLLEKTEERFGTLLEKTEERFGTLLEKTEERFGTLLEKTEERIMLGVGELLEKQVLPQFDNLPDKSYFDDKLADVKGDLVVKVKRENEKVDFIVDLLRTRGILTEDDVRRIKQEFQIFPSS